MAHHFARFPGFGSLRGNAGGSHRPSATGNNAPVIPPVIPFDESTVTGSTTSSLSMGSFFKSSAHRKHTSTISSSTNTTSSNTMIGTAFGGSKMGMSEEFETVNSSPARDRERGFKPFIPDPEPISTLYATHAYRYMSHKSAWKQMPTSGIAFDTPEDQEISQKRAPCSQVTVITWNVDYVTPHAETRLAAILDHIAHEVLQCRRAGRGSDEEGGSGSGEDGSGEDVLEDEPEPSIIMLQEVNATAFPVITSNPWVRRWFVVSPISREKWPKNAIYGNVTLVSRRLHLAESHILYFGSTSMHRTGVCVKVKLNYQAPSRERVVLSFVNTHLESLPRGVAERPRQLELCTRFLKLDGVHGGIVAGDMNCVCDEDALLPKSCGLRDAFKPARNGEFQDDPETWGFQGQNEEGFPLNRLDKVLYLPAKGYKVDSPRRIGVGLKVGTPDGPVWVSDHVGLETTLKMAKPRSGSNDSG